MLAWRIAGYVFLALAVFCVAEFIVARTHGALGLAAVCLVLGVSGLALSVDRALLPVLTPISLACAGVTFWLTRRRPSSPCGQQPGEKE